MAQTVIEIKSSENSLNLDNSFFNTVYGEPVLLKSGSTVDFLNSFIDLGINSSDTVFVPDDIQLQINFFQYEYDVPRIPQNAGSPSTNYPKRTIYLPYDAFDIPAGQQGGGKRSVPIEDLSVQKPRVYGWKTALYQPSNLCAFLLNRTGTVTEQTGAYKTRTETFTPQLKSVYADLKAGYYSKVRLTQIINDQLNGITGGLSSSATKPMLNPDFSQLDYHIPPNQTNTLLEYFPYSFADASVIGRDPDALHDANEQGSVPNIYVNDRTKNNWFFPVYAPQASQNEPYLPYTWFQQNQDGFLGGASKFEIQFDNDSGLFYINYTFTPILDDQQREVIQFSSSQSTYLSTNVQNQFETIAWGEQKTGYKARGQLSGVLITKLASYKLVNGVPDKSVNTRFFQNTLGFGFDDAYEQEILNNLVNEERTFYYQLIYSPNQLQPKTVTKMVAYKFNISYPDPKYLEISSTEPLMVLQWIHQQNFTNVANDTGMSAYVNDIPKTFQSVGNRVIYGDSNIEANGIPYFLVEVNISHFKNDNFRDKDSFRQIMNICGKSYVSGTHLQSFNDASIQGVNIDEDLFIDKIEVKILNPDKTLAKNLGANSSVFLKLTQPITK